MDIARHLRSLEACMVWLYVHLIEINVCLVVDMSYFPYFVNIYMYAITGFFESRIFFFLLLQVAKAGSFRGTDFYKER